MTEHISSPFGDLLRNTEVSAYQAMNALTAIAAAPLGALHTVGEAMSRNKVRTAAGLVLLFGMLLSTTSCGGESGVTPSPDGGAVATLTALPPTESVTLAPTSTPTEIIPTVTLTPTEVPVEVKEFSVCKIESFRDCVITIEELLNGTYLRWLETLSKPFDTSPTSKMKDVPLIIMKDSNDVPTEIIYDLTNAPNFADDETKNFRNDVTSGVVWVEYNGILCPYIVKPIELFDKNDPTNNKWVITVESYYGQHPLTGEYVPVPGLDDMIAQNIKMWENDMNITPIMMNAIVPMSGSVDPLVQGVFDNNPDLPQLLLDFAGGDVGALSRPGIVVMTEDVNGGRLYK